MGKYSDQVKDLDKKKEGQSLEVVSWAPTLGAVLVGEARSRDVISLQKTNSHLDKLTLDTDEGYVAVILDPSILKLAQPPLQLGDLVKIEVPKMRTDKEGKEWAEYKVTVYHTAPKDPLPF